MPARLLVIEDSRADLELLEIALRDAGLSVWFDAVGSASEASSRIQDIAAGIEALPELIVLDLTLPDRPGEDVLREIRACAPLEQVPVVILTGSPSRQLELERLGADGYIVKPLRYADLLEAVEELRAFLPEPLG